MTPETPVKFPRFVSLFFSFAFAVIGLAVGINASVKSNQEKSKVYDAAPQGAVVDIDIHDIFDVGAVLTAGCGLLAVLSALYFVFTWFAFGNSSTSLRIQSCTLFFCAVWLFATLVPFDLFFATRQASVSATLDGITVSQSIIQNIEEALGISPVYREQSFLKLVAILPWFAFLFAIIAGLILHVAASRVSAYGGDSEKKPRKFFRANS